MRDNIIPEFLLKQISRKPDLFQGYNDINEFLHKNGFPVPKINLENLKIEFQEWLTEVLNSEPIPKEIKSIYFGIINMNIDTAGIASTTFYISGSTQTPEDGQDWACSSDYLPVKRYFIPSDFQSADESVANNAKLSGGFEVLVFNGLLNLLVMESMQSFRQEFMTFSERKFGLFKSEKKRNKL